MILAALGNPGKKYAHTRHNIAWRLVERLSFFGELSWEFRFNADFVRYQPGGGAGPVYILLPLTYMNLSGRSVNALMRFYKLDLSELLVIHDDIEMEFGVFGFKQGGGLGGHNGLRSVAASLGTRDFGRMRLGVSRPPDGDVSAYVLSDFHPEEAVVLPSILDAAAARLEAGLETPIPELASRHAKCLAGPDD